MTDPRIEISEELLKRMKAARDERERKESGEAQLPDADKATEELAKLLSSFYRYLKKEKVPRQLRYLLVRSLMDHTIS